MKLSHSLLPLLLGWVSAATADQTGAGAAEPPSVRAVRVAHAPMLDGVLSDTVWRHAPAATGFRQREPAEGDPATEHTEVRVLYDDTALYIGVLARHRDPDEIVARILQSDRIMEKTRDGKPQFAGDDAVAILLDPFHDHRNAVVFATNPNGAEFDALLTDEGRVFNIDWRGVWRVAARRVPEGWSAEFAFPFRTLRFPERAGESRWGLNIYRIIRRKNEEVLWSAWSRDNEGFARVSRAGHLEGMRNLPRPGLNLEAKPFTMVRATGEANGAGGMSLDAGLDAKYEVRPGLLLDLTLNTDFAQVEVDDQQVNLTRFSLFLPEKRDFFLENAGIFEFGVGGGGGGGAPRFLAFFSRRIGIAEEGEVPVLGGVRLSGRIGRQTVGLLNVLTDEVLGQPRTNHAVARLKRDVGGSGYIGAILTDRRVGGLANTAGGVDWSLWPTVRLNVQGFAARTATSGPGGDDGTYGATMDYQSDRLGLGAQHLMIGPEVNAEMGFITRTDMRRTQVLGRVTFRPPVLGLRKVDVSGWGNYVVGTDWRMQDWVAGPFGTIEWRSGESLSMFFDNGATRLHEGFRLADSVFVPPGEYAFQWLNVAASTNPARAAVLTGRISRERNFGGSLSTLTGSLGLNPDAHLSLRFGYTRGQVELPGGAFLAHVGSLRLAYAFSTRLTTNALLQYNSFDRSLSAYMRLNFLYRPGSDLFIVLNESRGSEQSLWAPVSRGVAVKLTYLKRF